MPPSPVRNLPPRPGSISETGLDLVFLADLTLKTIHTRGLLQGYEIADALLLPLAGVVDKALDLLRRQHLIQVSGAAAVGAPSYQYALSGAGRERARELMSLNQYVGPAPVNLDAYCMMVKAQSLANQSITRDELKRALAHLVLGDATIDQLGPAINAGRSVFLFGNTGDGKTSIALAIGTMLPGAMWVPYAVTVDGQIIKVYDALHHRAIAETTRDDDPTTSRKGLLSRLDRERVEGDGLVSGMGTGDRYDRRWVRIHRPLIVSGGELTLENLGLVFDPTTKCYEAPQQMKANGGVFLVDDLGRQRISPRAILNRWIVPLEKRVDYLTLATGYKFDVPFDVLILFVTNLDPTALVDEAILRRLRNKIHIPDPTWDEFREIFRRESALKTVPYSEESVQYLIAEHYAKCQRKPRGVHPRDLLGELVDIARFRGVAPTLSKELIDLACQSYFLE